MDVAEAMEWWYANSPQAGRTLEGKIDDMVDAMRHTMSNPIPPNHGKSGQLDPHSGIPMAPMTGNKTSGQGDLTMIPLTPTPGGQFKDCSDCKGSGQYIGFTVVEKCKACGGAGKIQVEVEAEATDDLAWVITDGFLNDTGTFTTMCGHRMSNTTSRCLDCGCTKLDLLKNRTCNP